MRNRIQTGIIDLDDILQGGLPQTKAYLVAGEPCTGKSTFCIQFLLQGAAKGQNGVYITIDEKPAHLIEDAEALGWNVKPCIELGGAERICFPNCRPAWGSAATIIIYYSTALTGLNQPLPNSLK